MNGFSKRNIKKKKMKTYGLIGMKGMGPMNVKQIRHETQPIRLILKQSVIFSAKLPHNWLNEA